MSTPVVRPPRVTWQVKFLAISLIWGASFLLIKIALEAFDPVQVGSGRVIIGGVTLAVLLAITGTPLPRSRRVWAHLQVSALFICTLPFLLFPLGETRVSSALAGIGNATTPLATVLATIALVPQERLAAPKLVAVGTGFLGVIVISEPWAAAGRPDPLGFAIVVIAGSCYGVGWTYVKRFLHGADLGGLAMPAAQVLSGAAQMALVVLGWWLTHRDQAAYPWSPVKSAVAAAGTGTSTAASLGPPIASLIFLAVVGTGLAYVMQFDVYRAVGQQVGSTVTYLIPVVAVLLGVLVLDERLGWAQLAGFAVVLASAVAIGRPERRTR
ncbi:MAG: DMT family transporter [Candidatus Phosphoribacter sp.]